MPQSRSAAPEQHTLSKPTSLEIFGVNTGRGTEGPRDHHFLPLLMLVWGAYLCGGATRVIIKNLRPKWFAHH